MAALRTLEPEDCALVHAASSCGTRYPRDLALQVLLIRGARNRDSAIRAVLHARADWLRWLTVTQRQWQAGTRRPSRARHHDSIGIREKYVRAGVPRS